MTFRSLVLCASSILALGIYISGCADAPGRPKPEDAPVAPSKISDFGVLYEQNCAGCHGTGGKGGAAIALGDPVYLAIASDAALHDAAANGISGTSMPAFAESAGGILTEDQINIIVGGIRERWSKPQILRGMNAPAYSSSTAGDSSRGSQVYGTYCSSCHGADGRGGQKASSVVDGSFLALLNDQELRTIIIVGRPELGAPDWRGDVPGKPMSEKDVSDVVAWLASQRPKFPGQPYPNTARTTGVAQ